MRRDSRTAIEGTAGEVRCRPLLGVLLAVGIVVGILGPAVGQRGYQLAGDQVIVDRASHWNQWTIPKHLANVERVGTVRARSLRTLYNVLDDPDFRRLVVISTPDARIGTVDSTNQLDVFGAPVTNTLGNLVFDHWMRPGISRVGSNPRLAANILDGDPTTFWEPDPRDPIENWWVEVHLGRVVPIERLKLRFVDEELGDPFLQYILLLSNRQSPMRDESTLRRIGLQLFVPSDAPNTTQREFIFESAKTSPGLPPADGEVSGKALPPLGRAQSPEWTGRLIETIRIVITDTRGGRAEQVTQAEWKELKTTGRQGDVAYFARDLAGRKEPVDEDTYNALEPARQDTPVFYRRELPRLADVEAWGWGENLGVNLIENGGSYVLTTDGTNTRLLFDGDAGTGFQHQIRNPKNPTANVLTVDFGGIVRLAQTRLIGSSRGYIMRSSTGERDAQGNFKWQRISSEQRERNVFEGNFSETTDIFDPPIISRFVEMITLGHVPPGFRATGPGGTGHMNQFWASWQEMMLLAEGAPIEVTLESDMIELPGLVGLGAVEWEADTPPGTEVEIRTRTGDQLLQQIRYFDNTGNEKTAEQYGSLAGFLKGPSDTTMVIGPGWSSWSRKYRQSGDLATSPSLRRFMQVQARLLSDGGDVAGLERISVQLHQPVAQRLAAEVWPTEVQAGRIDTFSLFLQPDFIERPTNVASPGFDELLVSAEPALDLRLLDVSLGTEAELETDRPFMQFSRHGDGRWIDAKGGELAVGDEGEKLLLRLPELIQAASADELTPVYYRSALPGDEVPISLDRKLLTFTSYNLLRESERGAVRYFEKLSSGALREVTKETYEGLDSASQGAVRYFRTVTGLGDQVPFNALGDSLDRAGYNRLGGRRGWVVGRGRLLRVRFVSPVFLQGTRIALAVRRSDPETPWQTADGGDVTALSPSRSLSIRAGGASSAIADIVLSPNPFTPNGDGVNDEVQISFSLFRVQSERPAAIRVFDLAGRRVWERTESIAGGAQQFSWDGRDDSGNTVRPGLYLCQIEVEADSDAFGGQTKSRLIAVAY